MLEGQLAKSLASTTYTVIVEMSVVHEHELPAPVFCNAAAAGCWCNAAVGSWYAAAAPAQSMAQAPAVLCLHPLEHKHVWGFRIAAAVGLQCSCAPLPHCCKCMLSRVGG
jgi:hypothetical protein